MSVTHHRRTPEYCNVAGCNRAAICKSLCGTHYVQMRKGIQLVMRTKGTVGATPPWEWPGDENVLAAMTAAQENAQ